MGTFSFLQPTVPEVSAYQPRPVEGFVPTRIVLAKGSHATPFRRELAEKICAAYPGAEVIEAFDTAHNRVRLTATDPLELQKEGKRTLVLAEHRSAVRESTEEGNSCPNYWHFSPYGFCPYNCTYCYLAGTQGVRFSPTVKIFLNLPEIVAEVERIARRLGTPTAFYLGKLQDGLALDPLTGYSTRLVPFFAQHPFARLTLLTKSDEVGNLLELDHRGHAILSWTVNALSVIEEFERDTPSLENRLRAMEQCVEAGYPVRAVVMPIIPVADWESVYGEFFEMLLSRIRLSRLTLGSICSYPQALRLTEQKLGRSNRISSQIERQRGKATDGRYRFSQERRLEVYRHLLNVIRRRDKALEVGLCLEETSLFDALDMKNSLGRCNCVL